MTTAKGRPCETCQHYGTITHRTGYPRTSYCHVYGDFRRENCQPLPATLPQLLERINRHAAENSDKD